MEVYEVFLAMVLFCALASAMLFVLAFIDVNGCDSEEHY